MKAEKGKNAIAYCRRHREKLARFSVGPETNLLRKQKSDFLPSHGKSYKKIMLFTWLGHGPLLKQSGPQVRDCASGITFQGSPERRSGLLPAPKPWYQPAGR
ncbi:predicted protein [Brucella suis bv. 3 str. 686]|nr:predicted protein [Brucella suis bv. 3 str. 686]